MDIMAKHVEPDEDGVRIAKLNERSYREQLWNHRPLTDFWRVGRGYAKKLEENGLYTMGDIARCSMGSAQEFYNEELLYRLFGVNAELLIDHAWGWEPCTMEAIKNYKLHRTVSVPVRCSNARIPMKGRSDRTGNDRTSWYWIWLIKSCD